jgi:hypothetical protein
VLHRLQTDVPAQHTAGCRCLESDAPETREPLQHPLSIPWKGETMPPSTLEPLTILSPIPSAEYNNTGEAGCGCGCGCGASLTQLVLPQDVIRPTGDQTSAPPRRS